MPIKEPQIVDYFLGEELKDEVMKISPVQKQSAAGQRTRFKAYVVIGDNNGHLGLGVKCAKEVATAIRAAIMLAKLTLIPIRRGYWGGRFGDAHTVPTKVTGKCGSVRFRLIPAPKGTGIVAAKAAKKILTYAGVRDCYTSSRGQSGTMGNLMTAVYRACAATYGYLTPDLWPETAFKKTPFQQFTDHLKESSKPKAKGE
jgi:small subunit ribosomal protein S2e